MPLGGIVIGHKVKNPAAVSAVLDFILVREIQQHTRGDLEMAFGAHAMAHDRDRFFAAINPAVEDVEERFRHVFAKRFELSLLFTTRTRSVQLEFLQNE